MLGALGQEEGSPKERRRRRVRSSWACERMVSESRTKGIPGSTNLTPGGASLATPGPTFLDIRQAKQCLKFACVGAGGSRLEEASRSGETSDKAAMRSKVAGGD